MSILDTILHGDSLEQLRTLPDESVQCCITSPPYWGLRDYGCDGQLGLEPTPEQYVAKMVEIFAEVRRVLRPDGTLWLNLGDSYASNGVYLHKWMEQHPDKEHLHTNNAERYKDKKAFRGGEYAVKAKDLIGIPWRVAFALQQDGWYLRSDIIWSKPNPMPESVTDRPTKAHEYVFLMSKSARYYYDHEAVKEELLSSESVYLRAGKSVRENHQYGEVGGRPLGSKSFATMPTGRNRRTVWTIPTHPCFRRTYPEAHFAVFPETLVEPCLLAGTSEKGCCPECGAAWERVVERTKYKPDTGERFVDESRGDKTRKLSGKAYNESVKILSEKWQPSCSCPEHEPIPCTVLDPFMGSGTVAKVALRARRHYIGIELNEDYIRLAEKRLAPLKAQVNLL